ERAGQSVEERRAPRRWSQPARHRGDGRHVLERIVLVPPKGDSPHQPRPREDTPDVDLVWAEVAAAHAEPRRLYSRNEQNGREKRRESHPEAEESQREPREGEPPADELEENAQGDQLVGEEDDLWKAGQQREGQYDAETDREAELGSPQETLAAQHGSWQPHVRTGHLWAPRVQLDG